MSLSATTTPATRLLAGVLAPLRLPKHAIEALDAVTRAAGHLGPIRAELASMREQTASLSELGPELERVRQEIAPLTGLAPGLARLVDHAEPLAKILPALERIEDGLETRLDGLRGVADDLEEDESNLDHTVKQLVRELTGMHATLSDLADDVRRVTDRLPDPDAGPLEKARAVLTGAGH
jgi:ABC-type transporter Mla subunit MlaD